nr:zinc finger protein Dzip1-like [Procambarus clarkii]
MKTTLGTMSPGGAVAIPSVVEFPSQRRERVDWHKLASIDLHELSSGCTIEVLQDNLSHVAFCDAEAEFDGTTAGQRSLLKMFRLAQLIIQYLFLSQEFVETQLQQSQEEIVQITEKYQQVKTKLLEQVEEAKKMKITNRNMRETVKYINSFALANGIFQSLKCPMCPKTFRGQDFLQSHLWRKHPNQASAVTLPQTTQVPSAVSGSCVAQTVTSETKNQELHPTKEVPLESLHTRASSNVNDIDLYKLTEIEKKFNVMNENFNKIIREMEEQKRYLEKENEKGQEEIKKAWEEKYHTERVYEAQLEKLSVQIAHLQLTNSSNAVSFDNERFVELIKKQENEIKCLHAQIQEHAENNKAVGLKSGDTVDGLFNEIQALKKQVSDQKKSYKCSLKQMQEALQKNYDEALEFEKTKLRVMMTDISHKEAPVAIISQKPPPSTKSAAMRKPPTSSRATKSSNMIHDLLENSETLAHLKVGDASHLHYMDAHDSETQSESESETETSQWNQSSLKVKQLEISSSIIEQEKDILKPKIERAESLRSEHSYSESSKDDMTPSENDTSSESLNLDDLLKDNPQLWNQMREATSDVLASKLLAYGIDSSASGIKLEILTSCLSQLRKERRLLVDKYDNFLDLRKKLENEVIAKVDDKIDNVDDISGINPIETVNSKAKEKQSGILLRMVKNVQSRVRKQSKALSSSVSKTSESMKLGVKDIFHDNIKPDDNIKAITGTCRVFDNPDENIKNEKEDGFSETESDDSSSAQIEIHNETSKSVSRNLFNDEPLPETSGARPKRDNYFDNKTYGEVQEVSDSDWDSDPKYENVKKDPPPKRSDSLNTAVVSANLHNVTADSWKVTESKEIKLKKPEGAMVSNLARTIELQLSGRKKGKPTGAVDVMCGSLVPNSSQEKGTFSEYPNTNQTSPFGSRQQLQSASDSSNTFRTSLWGSVDAVDKVSQVGSKLSASKRRDIVHSWDSDDDIDISEIE